MKRFIKTWLATMMVIFLPMAVFAAGDSNLATVKIFSLDDCLKLGFENNNQLLLAKSNIEMYQKEVQRVSGKYMPTVTYGFDNTYKNQSSALGTLSNDYYDGQATVSQPLYAGGKIDAGYKIAKLNLESAFEDKRKAEQELTYQIKAAYYDMWLKQQNLIIAETSQNNMGKHYQLVNRMYKIGNANKLELYQAQGQWEEQKVATETTKNEVAQAKLTLATLIGIDQFQNFSVEFDLGKFHPADLPAEPIQDTVKLAYQERPETHKAKLNIEIAEKQIKLAEAGFLPTVALSGSYSVQSKELNANWDKSFTLALSLSGTTFDGFSTQAGIASAKQRLKSAQIQEKIQQDQIFTDVAQSMQSLKQSLDLIRSTQLNVDFMKERVRLTELQYNNGKANTSDFIDAQTSLDKAYNSYYGQIMSYLSALAKLDYAIGKDAAPGEGQ